MATREELPGNSERLATAAVADARCHNATGLASIWASVEAEHQWALLPAHADALADLIGATTLPATPN